MTEIDNKFYCKVKVVDEMMGMGKSSAAINYINSLDDDVKVMYVTPYLDEVERIKKSCESKKMKEPTWKEGRKIESLRELIIKGENIVTTHALFHHFDGELIDLCWRQNYILFLDEVTDVIETYSGLKSKQDLDVLLDNFASIDTDSGIIKWRDDVVYNGEKFADEKRMCKLGSLACYGDGVMMWLFPMRVFNAFREIYILTYMFDAQMQAYYYKYHNLPYTRLYITGDDPQKAVFTENESEKRVVSHNFRELITIVEDDKLNRIGDKDTDLSKSWYERNKRNGGADVVKNNLYNFFRHRTGLGTSHNLWATFSDYKGKLKGKGYTNGFAPINSRATNKYSDCDCVAYTVNRFLNPVIVKFFEKHGIEVNEEDYALSEMLQFIWRSAIRKGKPITIYIPSSRMRRLLKKWIEENSCENSETNQE